LLTTDGHVVSHNGNRNICFWKDNPKLC